MNLNKISREIIDSVNMNQNSYKATKDSIAEIIEKELKEKIVDILEPENVYEKGKTYEGHGEYIGIVDSYPYDTDYFIRNHHFRIPTPGRNEPSTINQIFIREIKK